MTDSDHMTGIEPDFRSLDHGADCLLKTNKDGFVRAGSHANTSWTRWSIGNLIECCRSPLDQCKAMACKGADHVKYL